MRLGASALAAPSNARSAAPTRPAAGVMQTQYGPMAVDFPTGEYPRPRALDLGRPGETPAPAARLGRLSSALGGYAPAPQAAVDPAGAATTGWGGTGYSSDDLLGGSAATGGRDPLTNSQGLSEGEARNVADNQRRAWELGATLVNRTADAVTEIIRSGSAARIAELQTAASNRISDNNRQIQIAQNDATKAAEVARLTAENTALQTLNTSLATRQIPPETNTGLYIALGLAGVVGVVAVGALIYTAVRKNPRTGGAADPQDNPVMVRDGRRKFVPAAKAAKARARGWSKAPR